MFELALTFKLELPISSVSLAAKIWLIKSITFYLSFLSCNILRKRDQNYINRITNLNWDLTK